MSYTDSTNGYCNLWIIGKNAVGKTSLINRILDDEKSNNSLSTRGLEIIDTLITDGEHNVKLHISEIHSLNDMKFYDKFDSQIPSIFLILVNTNIYTNLKVEKEIIKTIEDTIPNSLIFYLINNDSKVNVPAPPLNSKMRDVFDITNFNSNEFHCFKNILKNTIINVSTNRLRKVKRMISKSLHC